MALPQYWGLAGFERGLAVLHRLPAWCLILAVCVGGFAEEALYRGVAYGLISDIVGSVLAVIIVSLAFAVAHVPLWGWGPALTIGISGAMLTVAYAVHGDLWANALAHVTVDFVGIVAPRLTSRR